MTKTLLRIINKLLTTDRQVHSIDLISEIRVVSGGNRILNPDEIKRLPHITDCKTEYYAKDAFGAFSYVSIMALICTIPTLIFCEMHPRNKKELQALRSQPVGL